MSLLATLVFGAESVECSVDGLLEQMVLWCGRDALSAAGLLDVAALECALEAGVYDTRPQGMTIFTTSIILLFYNTYFTLYSPSPDRIIQYYLATTCMRKLRRTPSRDGVSRLPFNGDASGRDHARH